MSDSESPARLEKDVEADRAALHQTLDQLRGNMQPARMASEILTTIMGRRYETPSAVRPRTMSESLIDLGAAVLFGSSLRALKRTEKIDGSVESNLQEVEMGADATHARVVTGLDRAGAGADSAASRISESAAELRQASGPAASKPLWLQLSAKANDAAAGNRATAPIARLVAEKPFAVGAVGAAIGAAVGMSFAMTRTENDLMGESSAAAKRAGRAMARERYERLKQVTSQTIDDLRQTVVDHGVSADNASGLVNDLASTVRNAAAKTAS